MKKKAGTNEKTETKKTTEPEMKATAADLERERLSAALYAIVEGNNGVLNPRHVVDVARDPTHVLHRYFEWNDGDAAESYRLLQVGALVRHVRFTVVRADPATRQVAISTTRGYQSRPSMRKEHGGYEPVTAILSDPEKRAELLAQVIGELTAYRRRYAELSELQPVWFALDEARADLSVEASSSALGGDESTLGSAG
jgi:hypothetical protein